MTKKQNELFEIKCPKCNDAKGYVEWLVGTREKKDPIFKCNFVARIKVIIRCMKCGFNITLGEDDYPLIAQKNNKDTTKL